MSKLNTFNFLSPASFSSENIVCYAAVLGLMLKWVDVIADKELHLTEEQYKFHSKFSVFIFSILCTHYCLINMTCAAMGSGLVMGCIMGMKIDVIEHIIPSIICLSVPYVIAHYFKDASWNGLDLSSKSVVQGICTFLYISAVSGFEEIYHEMAADHPNELYRNFIDHRPIAPIVTGLVAVSMKFKSMPKNLQTLCEWNMIFVASTTFLMGYETMRHVRDHLNDTVLAGNI